MDKILKPSHFAHLGTFHENDVILDGRSAVKAGSNLRNQTYN
jgi:hypothetical protein